MQDLGKILMIPKGDYVAGTLYEFLDVVNYNDSSWICKKNCKDQVPSDTNDDYWQKLGTAVDLTKFMPKSGGTLEGSLIVYSDEDATRHVRVRNAKRSVEMASYEGGAFRLYDYTNSKAIISSTLDGTNTFNGTATNADTVDGKHAEDFHTAPINVGFPSGSNIEISFSGDTVALISTIGWNSSFYSSYLYHGYAAGSVRQKVVNLTTSGSFPYEISETEQKLIIHNGTVSSGACSIEILHGNPCTTKIVESPTTYPTTTPLPEIYATAKGNLPLSGGRIIKDGASPLELESTSATSVWESFYSTLGYLGRLGFSAKETPAFMTTGGGIKELLHTGNKPSGTYTGNGSATERTINIGGIGEILKIDSSASGTTALVTGNGALVLDAAAAEIQYIHSSECKFVSGVLYLATTHKAVNRASSANNWTLI